MYTSKFKNIFKTLALTMMVMGGIALAAETEGTKSSNEKQKTESTQTAQTSDLININTANAETLDALPRVGPKTAKRIIEHREEHGGFKAIEEIMNVKGIGPKTFERLKDKITL